MALRHVPLLIAARRRLGLSQGALGQLLGSSRRTGQRWESGGSVPADWHLHKLAALIHPLDSELAELIADAGHSTLLALGVVEPPPPPPPPPPAPPPPPPPPPPVHAIVDAVVCAAAEAIDVTPKTIRPALLAAFRRARSIGLGVDAVANALEAAETASKASPEEDGQPGTAEAAPRDEGAARPAASEPPEARRSATASADRPGGPPRARAGAGNPKKTPGRVDPGAARSSRG